MKALDIMKVLNIKSKVVRNIGKECKGNVEEQEMTIQDIAVDEK